MVLVMISISGIFDQTFCANGCGGRTEPLFAFAYSMFGHWGAVALTLAGGLLCIFNGVRSAEVADEPEKTP